MSRNDARKLRVLVLTSTFPRWAGDTEPRFVLDLCRRLLAVADVLVIAPHAPGAAREEVLEGVAVRRFRYFWPRWQAVAYQGGIAARLREKPSRLLQLPLFFASLWWAIRRSVRAWSPDVVHAHWIIPQALIARLAAAGRPIVCTSHGGDLYGLRSASMRRLKSWVLRGCRAITVVSDDMQAHARELAPDRPLHVIPMGTDLQGLFVPPPASAPRDPDHVVFLGRVVEKKGLRYLLEAFAAVLATHANARLSIGGDGPLLQEMRKLAVDLGIQERVAFLGGVTHREAADLYRRAALAVFPFVGARDGDQEGFGLVVVEAMGCGCPVIAGDVRAVRQTVEPGVTGLLTAPKNVDELAVLIRTVLSDSMLRDRLAGTALARARERFDWSPIARAYLGVLGDAARV
jgi:phosphatidyl-myo-inositol dimannoside synthase